MPVFKFDRSAFYAGRETNGLDGRLAFALNHGCGACERQLNMRRSLHETVIATVRQSARFLCCLQFGLARATCIASTHRTHRTRLQSACA